VRLDIRRVGAIKKEEDVIGNRTRVKVVKNKLAPPFKEVEFDILYGQGISREGDLVDLASEADIVEKSGAWFSYGGERIGQGRENAKQFLIEHPEVYASIEAKVLAHHSVRRIGIDEKPAAKVDSRPAADGDDRSLNKRAPVAPAASGPQATPQNGKRPNA
jgi:recombination protein RecA